MSTEQTTTKLCGWCDHPQENHGTRYTAGRGDHKWEPARGPAFIPYTRRSDRPCFCATTGDGAQHTCGTPSDRLPPRAREPETTPAPTMADLNAFAEEHAPDPAAEEATRQGIADRLGVDAERVQPDLVPRADGPALPAYRILTEPRAPWWRRILNARKANT